MEIDGKEKVDYLFKFIIIGDTGVGKSCILNQYLRGKCKYPLPLTQRSLYSQPEHQAHRRGRIRHEVRKSQLEDHQSANLGHRGPRTVQVSHSQLLQRLYWRSHRLRHHQVSFYSAFRVDWTGAEKLTGCLCDSTESF